VSSHRDDDPRRIRAAERRERAAERREHAAERRERQRGRGRARRGLDVETIVATALHIADEEGVDAVSMRRIATELRVGTMSLYHHVADKEELLELMADATSAELIVPGEILGDWREALRAIAHRTRDAFLRHPWLIDTAGTRPLVTRNALRHVEQSIAIVVGLDVDRDTAVAMVMATDDYTIGHVFRQSRIAAGDRPFSAGRDGDRVRDLLATGEFPHLQRVFADEGEIAPPPDTFDAGLEWLFDGMQAVLDARRG
jgi:AcrR family transcriptional regulator